MIITVTCNPAVDVTYGVEDLAPGEVHRVGAVDARPGGKGVNVARVLAQLGEQVVALGPGDATFEAEVAGYGVGAEFPVLLPRMRRAVTVVAPASTTMFLEPGHPAARDADDVLEELVSRWIGDATALVVSGSVAPGLSAALPTRLGRAARAAGVPVILDLDDEPLTSAAAAGGAVLMPNVDELRRLLGGTLPDDLATAVRTLAARNGAPVVATLGADGLIAAADNGCWQALPPEVVRGNATGAGDATAAGVALGLARGWSWPELLSHAVALGAAAVRAPVAGEVVLDAYRRWQPLVRVQPL